MRKIFFSFYQCKIEKSEKSELFTTVYCAGQRGQRFLVSVVFTSPLHPGNLRQCFAPDGVLPVTSLLLANTVSLVRACLSICLERIRGTQKEDVGLSSGGGGGPSNSSRQRIRFDVGHCNLLLNNATFTNYQHNLQLSTKNLMELRLETVAYHGDQKKKRRTRNKNS
jgi:hypothetical protein